MYMQCFYCWGHLGQVETAISDPFFFFGLQWLFLLTGNPVCRNTKGTWFCVLSYMSHGKCVDDGWSKYRLLNACNVWCCTWGQCCRPVRWRVSWPHCCMQHCYWETFNKSYFNNSFHMCNMNVCMCSSSHSISMLSSSISAVNAPTSSSKKTLYLIQCWTSSSEEHSPNVPGKKTTPSILINTRL